MDIYQRLQKSVDVIRTKRLRFQNFVKSDDSARPQKVTIIEEIPAHAFFGVITVNEKDIHVFALQRALDLLPKVP